MADEECHEGDAVDADRRQQCQPKLPQPRQQQVSVWYGFLAPRGTPKPVIDRIQRGVVQAMSSPDIRDRYVNEGADVTVRGPDELATLLRGEFAKWSKVVTDSGVRID